MNTLRLLKNVDAPLFGAAVLVAAVGCLMVSSAAYQEARYAALPDRQVVWVGLGLLIGLSLMTVDYRVYARWWVPLYVLNVALLFLVLTLGLSVGGAKRWIALGAFRLQPSEFAKILTVVTLAAFLHARRQARWRGGVVVQSLVHLAVPLGLILCQPDLGTALVLVVAWLALLWVWGIPASEFVALVVAGGLLLTGAWRYGLIRDYQKERFSAFLAPDKDPAGAGYQIIQSQIAIGAGGLRGAGLYRGSQNRLAFIPTQTTDFIFTIAGEEFGFIGCVALLGLYLFIIWRGLRIALDTDNELGSLVAAGVVTILAFQVFVNVGMSVRLTPVTGLPLPFASYGGSSMITCFMGIGLLESISMRRRSVQF